MPTLTRLCACPRAPQAAPQGAYWTRLRSPRGAWGPRWAPPGTLGSPGAMLSVRADGFVAMMITDALRCAQSGQRPAGGGPFRQKFRRANGRGMGRRFLTRPAFPAPARAGRSRKRMVFVPAQNSHIHEHVACLPRYGKTRAHVHEVVFQHSNVCLSLGNRLAQQKRWRRGSSPANPSRMVRLRCCYSIELAEIMRLSRQ